MSPDHTQGPDWRAQVGQPPLRSPENADPDFSWIPGWSALPPGHGPAPYGSVLRVARPRTAHRIIGACVAVVLVTGMGLLRSGELTKIVSHALGYTATGSHSVTTRTLAIPRVAGGYVRMTGHRGRRLVAQSRRRAEHAASKTLPTWRAAFKAAKIGFYAKAGATRLVFIGFSAVGSPQVAAALRSELRRKTLTSLLQGMGASSIKAFRAGLLGGALRCGRTTKTSTPITICAWADGSVLAVLTESRTTERELARLALTFRHAAEH